MDPYSTLQERQDLADGTAPEAQQRFFEMKQVNRETADPIALQVFQRAYKRRIMGLLAEYAHSPSADQAEFLATAVAGRMKPGRAAALIMDATRARVQDDMSGGPLAVRTIGANVAVMEMKTRGASEEATDKELASSFPTQMQEILRRDVFWEHLMQETPSQYCRPVDGPSNKTRLRARPVCEEDLCSLTNEKVIAQNHAG
jgi:hypothetical protein